MPHVLQFRVLTVFCSIVVPPKKFVCSLVPCCTAQAGFSREERNQNEVILHTKKKQYKRSINGVVSAEKSTFLVCQKCANCLKSIQSERNSAQLKTTHKPRRYAVFAYVSNKKRRLKNQPSYCTTLHITTILSSHFIKRSRYLPQTSYFHRFHQLRKNITTVFGYLL